MIVTTWATGQARRLCSTDRAASEQSRRALMVAWNATDCDQDVKRTTVSAHEGLLPLTGRQTLFSCSTQPSLR